MGVVRDPLPEAEKLLQVLFNETVAGLQVQHPDSRPFDEIAQKAGLGTVGDTSTMTRSAVAFKDLERSGAVEAVKDVDGPLRYRITRLGERHVLRNEFERMEATWRDQVEYQRGRAEHHELEERRLTEQLAAATEKLTSERRQHQAELDRVAVLMQDLEDRARPWWRRLRRGGQRG